MLRDGEVKVDFASGEEATAARLLNQPFRKHARTGLPLVTLKMAMSLDGQTSTGIGQSKWISGEQSRALVHAWRADTDAIAVGIGTVFADDPLLSARVHDARQPQRIVFDSQARLPLDSQLLATVEESAVLIVTGPGADPGRVRSLESAGADVLVASGSSRAARVEAALADLGRRGVTSLFLEGGRTLASAFVAAEQVDRSHTFVAPLLLGSAEIGSMAPGPARLMALESSSEQVGDDTLITARYREW